LHIVMVLEGGGKNGREKTEGMGGRPYGSSISDLGDWGRG